MILQPLFFLNFLSKRIYFCSIDFVPNNGDVMKTLAFFFLSIAAIANANATNKDSLKWLTEPNSIRIYANQKIASGISEEQFNEVIDKLEEIYSPIVSRMGGTLKVNRLWEDPTANASATRDGKIWEVNMYGGLARFPTTTQDGFYLVLCHEIGHHLGGAPKIINDEETWASNEGQSDYFSTAKCLRKVFNNDNNETIVSKLDAPKALTDTCSKSLKSKEDRLICIRGGMAGFSVASFFAKARNQSLPKFETPDLKEVNRTYDGHPDTQCRLDTYLQGALCEKSFNEDVSQSDEVKGTCHSSTGYKIGLRPKCWFKSK